MILGHLPAALAGSKFAFGRYPNPLALFVLAYLPDFLDKNLYYVFGLTSRGYFHSLPVAGLSCMLFYAAGRLVGARDAGNLARRLLLFYVLHILCDWVELRVLLWPIDLGGRGLSLNPSALEAGEFDFRTIVHRFYILRVYPWWLLSEVFCFVLALVLLVRSWLTGELRIPRLSLGEARRARREKEPLVKSSRAQAALGKTRP